MTDKKSQKLKRLGCGILSIVVVGPILFVMVQIVLYMISLYPILSPNWTDSSSPRGVALSFAYSFPFGNKDLMDSYVARENQSLLDNMLASRQPVSKACRFPIDPDAHGLVFGGLAKEGKSEVSLFYSLDCPGYNYALEADLRLEDSSDGWKIVGWNNLCERRGQASTKCWDSESGGRE